MTKLIKILLEHKVLLFFAIVLTTFITLGSLISTSSIPMVNIEISDKIIHLLAYFSLFIVWTFYGASSRPKTSTKKCMAVTAILVFIYGIVIEVLQEQFMPTRGADLYDVVANAIGILLGILIFTFAGKNILKLKNEN